MSDSSLRYYVERLPVPIRLHGLEIELTGVTLSQDDAGADNRVGLLIRQPGEPEAIRVLFLRLGQAGALRDALTEILQVHTSHQQESN